MRSLIGMLLLSWGACAQLAHAQAITLFELSDFRGRQMSADQAIADFESAGMNDIVNSAIVRNGAWEVCTDAYFRGKCAILRQGVYPNLADYGLGNNLSSAQPAGMPPEPPPAYAPPVTQPPQNYIPAPAAPPQSYAPPPPAPAPPAYVPAPSYVPPPSYTPPPPGAPAPIVLFDQYDFGGSSIGFTARVDNLDITQWNDRAQSMVVNSGAWQLCSDAYYRGSCSVYGPGSYRDIGRGLAHAVSSIRPADDRAAAGYPAPPTSAYPPAPGPAARLLLFSAHDLRGASIALDYATPNLDPMGFNDLAASLRVEAGYWQLCSDAGYQGECRTFGPGDYPNLAYGFERKISSARPVNGP